MGNGRRVVKRAYALAALVPKLRLGTSALEKRGRIQVNRA